MAGSLLKKTLDFGLGLAFYSKDKIEAMVEEMVSRGEVARKDARKMADELVERGMEGREQVRRMVSEEVQRALSRLGIANEAERRAELAAIVREQVELALAAHQAGQPSGAGQPPEAEETPPVGQMPLP